MESPTPAAVTPKPKSPLRRWTVRLLRGAVLIYLGVVLVIFFLQTKLIFPGAARQGQRDTLLQPSQTYELLTLTANNEKIAAIFGGALDPAGQPLAGASTRPTILYFYGNASSIADATEEFGHFRRAGFNVMVPDFIGYGMSTGSPSEANCYATADAAYDYLLTRKDIDTRKIVAAGWSLGAAVAIDLASRKHVIGLMSFCAFTRMRDMAHLVIPWAPTSLILRHHFNNLAKLPKITCPILLVHGAADTIIPPAMSAQLAAVATSPLTKVLVPLSDHNDIFTTGGDALMDTVSNFISRLK